MKSSALFMLATAAATILGWVPTIVHAADVTLSGSAFYRERMALPDNASLVVELVDLAQPEQVLAQTRLAPSGQVPIAFSLLADKPAADQAHALKARIEVAGGTWFTEHGTLPVKASEPVSILLVGTKDKAIGSVSASALAGTTWRLVALAGKEADTGVISTLVFNAEGGVNGNGGCNSFGGGVAINGTEIKFGDLFSTMMGCEEAKSKQETAFHAALKKAEAFRLDSQELVFLNSAGAEVARLKSAP